MLVDRIVVPADRTAGRQWAGEALVYLPSTYQANGEKLLRYDPREQDMSRAAVFTAIFGSGMSQPPTLQALQQGVDGWTLVRPVAALPHLGAVMTSCWCHCMAFESAPELHPTASLQGRWIRLRADQLGRIPVNAQLSDLGILQCPHWRRAIAPEALSTPVTPTMSDRVGCITNRTGPKAGAAHVQVSQQRWQALPRPVVRAPSNTLHKSTQGVRPGCRRTVVLGSINSLQKLSEGLLRMWLSVLQRVPCTILWMLQVRLACQADCTIRQPPNNSPSNCKEPHPLLFFAVSCLESRLATIPQPIPPHRVSWVIRSVDCCVVSPPRGCTPHA